MIADLFIAIVTIIVGSFIDSPIYLFKELFTYYNFLFISFIIITLAMYKFKLPKYSYYLLWTILFLSIFVHSLFIYKKNDKTPMPVINFYGFYNNDKERLTKTDNDKLLDEKILKLLNNERLKVINQYLPNHILYFLGKEKSLEDYQKRNELLSVLIYKEDNIYKIINFSNMEGFDVPFHTQRHLELIKHIFSEILNLNSTNKEEVIKDLLEIYQQEILRIESYKLLNNEKEFDLKKAFELYSISTNSILKILDKYKRLLSNNDLINKINSLYNFEESISKYTLALINIEKGDNNTAINNLINCLQLSPHYPYYTYKEFYDAYKSYSHVELKNANNKVKSGFKYAKLLKKDEDKFDMTSNSYQEKLWNNFQEITPPYLIIMDILKYNYINTETSEFIETQFKNLMSKDDIFKLYLIEIIKFVPKGKITKEGIYIDRLDEIINLLKSLRKQENNDYEHDLINLRLYYLYKSKSHAENKDYSKEINEHEKLINIQRLKYGPTP